MLLVQFCFLFFLSISSGFLILPDANKLPGYSSLLSGANSSLTNVFANYLQTVGNSYKQLASLLGGGSSGGSGGSGFSSLPGMGSLTGGSSLPGMGLLTGGNSLPGMGLLTGGNSLPGMGLLTGGNSLPGMGLLTGGNSLPGMGLLTGGNSLPGMGLLTGGNSLPGMGLLTGGNSLPGMGLLTGGNSLPGMGLLTGGNSLPGMGLLTGGSSIPGMGSTAGGNAAKLEQYNVDRTQISVSGISAGGATATQFHVIFSKDIMGVGLIAGLPYGCSGGNMMTAVTTCMTMPSGVSAASLESRTEAEAGRGEIDAVSSMANDKVYILNGRADTTVNPGIGSVIESYYKHFVSNHSNIKTNFDINSQHCMPTDNYGVACSQPAAGSHYISNCNFSAAYHLLNHIYGGHLKMPTPEEHATGKLLKFSQSEFFPSSTHGSMDTTGYIYIPSGCLDKTTECKLHVAFHGCLQGQDSVGDSYVRHSGYNEVGELNNIIILYPQAVKSTMSPMNPNGCWDWWGYTGQTFDKKSGFQPTAIKRMIDRITG